MKEQNKQKNNQIKKTKSAPKAVANNAKIK